VVSLMTTITFASSANTVALAPSETPSSAVPTSAAVAPGTSTPTASPEPASSTDSGISGTKMVAILVPILVVLGLIPIIYLLYIRHKSKRERRQAPELRIPPETSPLNRSSHNSMGSRHNSIALPSPFSDSERIQSGPLGIFDRPMLERPLSGRPSSELERVPSPTLPSPSMPTFRTQEAWPLPAEPSALPVHPYESHFESFRPPSSQYGTPQTAQFGESVHALSSSSAGSNPFRNRDSDAISEMSFNPNVRLERTKSRKDMDEVSMVSALSPDDGEDRHFDHLH